ncbi:hypothetical protein, partial [Glaciimonas sp. GG7]
MTKLNRQITPLNIVVIPQSLRCIRIHNPAFVDDRDVCRDMQAKMHVLLGQQNGSASLAQR